MRRRASATVHPRVGGEHRVTDRPPSMSVHLLVRETSIHPSSALMGANIAGPNRRVQGSMLPINALATGWSEELWKCRRCRRATPLMPSFERRRRGWGRVRHHRRLLFPRGGFRMITNSGPGHPRVGGEHPQIVYPILLSFGSSPRGRGTSRSSRSRLSLPRVIPAWAGNISGSEPEGA